MEPAIVYLYARWFGYLNDLYGLTPIETTHSLSWIGERGWGGQIPMNRLSHALQPARQKRPSVTTSTVDVKVVGTLPERSSLLTLQLSLSTAVQNSHGALTTHWCGTTQQQDNPLQTVRLCVASLNTHVTSSSSTNCFVDPLCYLPQVALDKLARLPFIIRVPCVYLSHKSHTHTRMHAGFTLF